MRKEALIKKKHTHSLNVWICAESIALMRKTYWQKKMSALNYTWSKMFIACTLSNLADGPIMISTNIMVAVRCDQLGWEGWSWGGVCSKKNMTGHK